jgi:hypothetical protein
MEQTVGGEWVLKDHTGGTEEWGAIQSVASTWLRKTGDEFFFFFFFGPRSEKKR